MVLLLVPIRLVALVDVAVIRDASLHNGAQEDVNIANSPTMLIDDEYAFLVFTIF